MATKAIKITNVNVKRLEGEYSILEEDDLKSAVGYWMLVQFGSESIMGFLADSVFIASYDVLYTLDNGWFDVAAKKGGPV